MILYYAGIATLAVTVAFAVRGLHERDRIIEELEDANKWMRQNNQDLRDHLAKTLTENDRLRRAGQPRDFLGRFRGQA